MGTDQFREIEKLRLETSKEDFNNTENTELQNIKSYGNQFESLKTFEPNGFHSKSFPVCNVV